MKGKKFGVFLFVLALVCALVASTMMVKVIDSYRNVKQVVRVINDIPPYTQIKKEDVEWTEVPEAATTETTITELNAVVGKYSRTLIPKGNLVDIGNLSTLENAKAGVALPLSEFNNKKMRAIGLPEEFIKVISGNIGPGDHVDLIAVFSEDKKLFSKTIAYGVQVLQKNLIDDGGGVVVAVTAQQAEQLALAMNFGKIVVSVTPYEFESEKLQGTSIDSLSITNEGDKK